MCVPPIAALIASKYQCGPSKQIAIVGMWTALSAYLVVLAFRGNDPLLGGSAFGGVVATFASWLSSMGMAYSLTVTLREFKLEEQSLKDPVGALLIPAFHEVLLQH
eukprot:m.356120 g.356120  ORF g.356120 m.356120 type:complete len:106 (+) comp55951_c0_seq1:1264-1581(+)